MGELQKNVRKTLNVIDIVEHKSLGRHPVILSP